MSMGYQPYNMQVKSPSLHWAQRALTDGSSPPGSHVCSLPARRVCFCLLTDYSVLGSVLLPTESHDYPSRPGCVSASPAALHDRAAAHVPAGEPSPSHLAWDSWASFDPLHEVYTQGLFSADRVMTCQPVHVCPHLSILHRRPVYSSSQCLCSVANSSITLCQGEACSKQMFLSVKRGDEPVYPFSPDGTQHRPSPAAAPRGPAGAYTGTASTGQ